MSAKVIGRIDLDNKVTKEQVTVERKGNSIHFSVTGVAVYADHAKELQGQLGYHPLGYGFNNFVPTTTGTTWRCWSSCD